MKKIAAISLCIIASLAFSILDPAALKHMRDMIPLMVEMDVSIAISMKNCYINYILSQARCSMSAFFAIFSNVIIHLFTKAKKIFKRINATGFRVISRVFDKINEARGRLRVISKSSSAETSNTMFLYPDLADTSELSFIKPFDGIIDLDSCQHPSPHVVISNIEFPEYPNLKSAIRNNGESNLTLRKEKQKNTNLSDLVGQSDSQQRLSSRIDSRNRVVPTYREDIQNRWEEAPPT